MDYRFGENPMTKIIGISGIAGSGKSIITKELGKALSATTIFWDDFDEISESPANYIEWYKSDRNYNAWKYDALANVLRKLKMNEKVICPATKNELIPTNYIAFDAPLGRKHIATGRYIDFSVYLDTPLDIALARRLLRDYKDKNNDKIIDELNFYLVSSRPLYVMDYDWKKECDLIVDGTLSIDKQIQTISSNLHEKKL